MAYNSSDDTPLVERCRVESVLEPGDDNAYEVGSFASSILRLDSSSSAGSDATQAGGSLTAPRQLSNAGLLQRQQWRMNYQEAAIYLEEGKNNEKFDTHPKNQAALPAYLIAHHPFFHIIDFLASILLLSLAIIEPPSVANIKADIELHASLELLGIFILSLDIFFKARWQGVKSFFKHKRSLFKSVLLVVMVCEAITVIVRRKSHVRITRSLRPLFVLDSHYCRGIRRFCRQLLLSLPRILELLFLLIFIMVIFSILGFYLFSSNPEGVYFTTLQSSFISLFVLLTTANYPDVMMPAYKRSHVSAIFFIVYISVELYFFMNLFLAVVYDTFTTQEKTKVRKLLLHERDGCRRAFKLLVSTRHPDQISLRHFAGLMDYYKPRIKKEEIYLLFKTLNTSGSGYLNINEFYEIFSIAELSWKETSAADYWFQKLPHCMNRCMTAVNWLVNLKWFDYFIYLVILGNFGTILYEAIYASINQSPHLGERPVKHEQIQLRVSWHSVMFTCIYSVECVLKLLGFGPKRYFSNGWNLFDLGVTLISIAGTLGDLFRDSFFYFVVLRPLRLTRIFKARKRYRDVLGTLFLLMGRLWSLVMTLILLYYFYAIIGMELFSKVKLVDCCKNNSLIAPYYSNSTGFYQENNFQDVFKSGVTLFELTVVNNWFIIMEGFAAVSSEWSRLYFMTFYIITMVVMTVVVAFILEAFMFKIQHRRTTDVETSIDHLTHSQSLSIDEIHMINNIKIAEWSGTVRLLNQQHATDVHFIGRKKRNKKELSIQMYADEITEWLSSELPTTSNQPDIVPVTERPVRERPPLISRNSVNDLPNIVRREDDQLNNLDIPLDEQTYII